MDTKDEHKIVPKGVGIGWHVGTKHVPARGSCLRWTNWNIRGVSDEAGKCRLTEIAGCEKEG